MGHREPSAIEAALEETEVYLGLAEIAAWGLAPDAASRSPAMRTDRTPAPWEHRRRSRVATRSPSLLRLEAMPLEVGPMRAGDLVGLRLTRGGPLEVGEVTRCASAESDRVSIHVRRISVSRAIVLASPALGEGERLALYVPDDAGGGRHDACVLSERAFDESIPLEWTRDGQRYALSLGRLYHRGRGWVLAGFEIAAAA